MIKQWKNENLGVNFFYVPNSKNNEILTSDGVLIPLEEFKHMNKDSYNLKKITNGGYDYYLSNKSERLVKKTIDKSEEISEVTTVTPKKTKPLKKVKKEKKSLENEIRKDKSSESMKMEDLTIVKNKKPFNLFDFIYPKLMIVLTMVCSILSIYFTGTYLQRLQKPLIAYSISTTMLVFGLVGSQMTKRSWNAKKYLQSFIFGITTVFTIGFSMLSSIDVNYEKYKIKHRDIEKVYNINDGKKLSYDLLKNEREENIRQIEILNEDKKFQQRQWVLVWDNDLKKNVELVGRITSTAQDKIKANDIRIAELTERNKEIGSMLIDYAESGITVEKIESETDRAKSLTDLIGSLLGISGNVVQLVFLLVPSFFIDIINILAVTIYCDKFEEDKKKKKK